MLKHRSKRFIVSAPPGNSFDLLAAVVQRIKALQGLNGFTVAEDHDGFILQRRKEVRPKFRPTFTNAAIPLTHVTIEEQNGLQLSIRLAFSLTPFARFTLNLVLACYIVFSIGSTIISIFVYVRDHEFFPAVIIVQFMFLMVYLSWRLPLDQEIHEVTAIIRSRLVNGSEIALKVTEV